MREDAFSIHARGLPVRAAGSGPARSRWGPASYLVEWGGQVGGRMRDGKGARRGHEGDRTGGNIFGVVKVGEKGQIVIPKEGARRVSASSRGDQLMLVGDEASGIALITSAALIGFFPGHFWRVSGRRRQNDERN